MSLTDKFKEEVSQIELRTDLTTAQKIDRITTIACATCAGVAIQPIPFADIFILTPLQAYFATRIAAIRGVPVSEAEASAWIKELVGMVGMGLIAQQIGIAIWKMVTFGMGGLLTIPLVYGLTYAIMRVSDAYFTAKANKEHLSEQTIKAIWANAFNDGKSKGADEERNLKSPRR